MVGGFGDLHDDRENEEMVWHTARDARITRVGTMTLLAPFDEGWMGWVFIPPSTVEQALDTSLFLLGGCIQHQAHVAFGVGAAVVKMVNRVGVTAVLARRVFSATFQTVPDRSTQ